MTNPPPTPPDPALWTWTDQFNRIFLGPDYVAQSGVSINSDQLRFGPLQYAPESAGLSTLPEPGTLRAALVPTRFQQADVQLQFDWRYTWVSTAGTAPIHAGIELVGGGRILRLANGRLEWGYDQPNGGMDPLGAFSTVPNPDSWQRVTLRVDTTQGRIQVIAGVESIDVALPGDYLAAMGDAQLRLIARQQSGTNQPPQITVWVDNLAIRNGDGTADLTTGTANSSGGVRLGGEWRFAPGPPDDSVGSDGDVWADSTTGTLSQKQGGSYVNVMQLLGAPGPQGIEGAQGVPGPQGDPGALTGTISVPVLLGDASPEGGLIIPVTAGGGLAGYELLGVDGPPVTLATSPDGAAWTDLALPATLGVGTQLRLTRTDTTGGVSVLRARLRQDGTPGDGGTGGDGGDGGTGGGVDERLTVHPDGHVTDTFGRAALGDPYTVEVGGFVSPDVPEIVGGAVRFHLPAGTDAAAPGAPDAGEHARICLPAATWDSGTGAVQVRFDLTHVSSAATQGDPPMSEFRVFLLGGSREWCWSVSTDGGGTLWFGTPEVDGQLFFNDRNVSSFWSPEDPTGTWVFTLDPAAGEVTAFVNGEEILREALPAEFGASGGGQVALGAWRSRIPASSSTNWPEQTFTLDNLVIRCSR